MNHVQVYLTDALLYWLSSLFTKPIPPANTCSQLSQTHPTGLKPPEMLRLWNMLHLLAVFASALDLHIDLP
jgi:hypothetical protein